MFDDIDKRGRAFDSATWRGAETAARTIVTAVRRRRASRRKTGRRPRSSGDAAAGLRQCLDEGNFAEGAPLAAELEERWKGGDRHEPGRALPILLAWLTAVGESERAHALARAEQATLAATDDGCRALDALGVGEPVARLPSGALNPRGLERLQTAGAPPEELLAIALERRRDFLVRPELHLVVHNLLLEAAPAEATRALARYLRSQGVGRVGPEGLVGGLARVCFAAPQPVQSGPLVSIIVSAYRAAGTIAYALASLVGQSYRNLEILVADDGGDDETAAIALGFARRDSRVRCFRSTANQGTYNVRNQLIARARGELLGFHDADDVALPTRIERQVRALGQAHSACLCNWLRVRPDGRAVFFRDGRASRLAVVSLLARREVFEQLGAYRSARFGADLEYLRRVEAALGPSQVARIRAPLLFGAWGETSLTRSSGAEALEDGYRSPARRAYSSAVATGATGEEFDQVLRDTGNWIAPSALEPLLVL